MADARDKAITAALATGVPIHQGYIAEVIDAIPGDVLVDLAIERGALVESGREELASTETLPDGRIRNHFRPLYRRATDGGGDG
jgi:hypothetical protein